MWKRPLALLVDGLLTADEPDSDDATAVDSGPAVPIVPEEEIDSAALDAVLAESDAHWPEDDPAGDPLLLLLE